MIVSCCHMILSLSQVGGIFHFFGTNSLGDLILEDLMKVYEATMFTLMKMWRFDVSCVD